MTQPQEHQRPLPTPLDTRALTNELTVILGYSELALWCLVAELPADHPALGSLRHVLRACDRVQALLRPWLRGD
jgi:hypothetical protein